MDKDLKALLEGCKDAFECIIGSEYVNWDALQEYSSAEILIIEIDKKLKELEQND